MTIQQAQAEYDALIAHLRSSDEYQGRHVREWDAYVLERPVFGKNEDGKLDPNIVIDWHREVWVSIQCEAPPQTAPPGTPGLGGLLMDRHWPADAVVLGNPKAPDWQPQPQVVEHVPATVELIEPIEPGVPAESSPRKGRASE